METTPHTFKAGDNPRVCLECANLKRHSIHTQSEGMEAIFMQFKAAESALQAIEFNARNLRQLRPDYEQLILAAVQEIRDRMAGKDAL